jgi:amidase
MPQEKTRRDFIKTAAAATALPSVVRSLHPAVRASFDPSYGTAEEALAALQAREVSSKELIEHVFSRIKEYNPEINAFVTLLEDSARKRAGEADAARARGQVWGELHGLPILIKNAFETAGVRTTSGSKTLENHVPAKDAVAVARLKKAGAIVVGKTNLPEFADDLQSYNEVAGTTNNPWDLSRTPGGSTGGGAAALAAGFGFLELGSDIGGSIRTPAHFCGVFGHKPTLDLVPVLGHIPPPPGVVGPPTGLAVAGPLARSAEDLLLELKVIAGPMSPMSVGYQWRMPEPRASRMKDFRIGFVLDDPFCPVSSEVRRTLEQAIEALRDAGANLSEGWPKGFAPDRAYSNYLKLLAGVFSGTQSPREMELLRVATDPLSNLWLAALQMPHAEWKQQAGEQLIYRSKWQEYFKRYDAFLMPENIVPAFKHQHQHEFFQRSVETTDGPRPHADMLAWISPATLTGCPATVAPAGRTDGGLPVGIQIMGPYLEDATPIRLASLISNVVGGFRPPPRFPA